MFSTPSFHNTFGFFFQRAPLEVAIRLERLKGCEDYELTLLFCVDVDVNFDLCMDDGAGPAMFGTGPQQLNGTAVEVDCSQWSGSTDLTSSS